MPQGDEKPTLVARLLRSLSAPWRRVREIKHLGRPLIVILGIGLAICLGLLCLRNFAERLARSSYDLPFAWRSTIDTREITLVYLDDYSAKQLGPAAG